MKKVFIVTYNDRFGNGDQQSVEVVLSKRKDFEKWLKEHNKQRNKDNGGREDEEEFGEYGEYGEKREEFDITEATIFVPKG